MFILTLKIIILVAGAVALIAHLAEFVRVCKGERDKEKVREERYERKMADSRRNLGGRFYNALERAARENATRRVFVRKADFESMFDVYVAHSNLDKSHDHLLTVRVLKSSGTGFEVIVDGVLWPWTRYCGPQDYFVDELLPRLVNVTRAYVK